MSGLSGTPWSPLLPLLATSQLSEKKTKPVTPLADLQSFSGDSSPKELSTDLLPHSKAQTHTRSQTPRHVYPVVSITPSSCDDQATFSGLNLCEMRSLNDKGTDIVQWLMKNLSIEDPVEAIHLGSLIAAQGYIFPISDHVLTMKDDGTFYRFQAPYFWPSNCWEPENTDYAIYLCKRTMQNKARLELADYEASVYGVTEESQSQSPVHIPSQPIRKTTKEDIRKQITFLNTQIDRHCLKMSKVAESLIAYTEQYVEYDPLITPAEPSNPWISDDIALWDIEMSKEPSQQRVKRWGFSFDEILKDQVGRDQFLRFLESEFSSENLRFWLAVQDLKKQPLQDVAKRVEEIWQEFLAPGAPSAINLDSHSYEITSQNVKDGGRYTFEDAQEHIYKLMKSDSYARFLRSNAYQDLLLAKKKWKTAFLPQGPGCGILPPLPTGGVWLITKATWAQHRGAGLAGTPAQIP
ncbi:Regulator of G-protein signaling 6 [Tupaia chinensis]|uniref:Regulator of G-protein signaling 6 n=1 Tax=Tupaia chinensis TaxID=246437 RepID=L8Y499_TUPCH|nr:Regulator of G-protein signaling 6 [Tupaia chinensis]